MKKAVIFCVETKTAILNTLLPLLQKELNDLFQIAFSTDQNRSVNQLNTLITEDYEIALIIYSVHAMQPDTDKTLFDIRKINLKTPIIIIVELTDIQTIANTINKIGIFKYLSMPIQNDELLLAVSDALEIYKQNRDFEKNYIRLQNQNDEFVAQINNLTSKLSQQNTELQNYRTSLEEAHDQLEKSEKMANLGQLMAGIAHEINNPVNYISGSIESLHLNLLDVRKILEKYEEIDLDNVAEKLSDIRKLKKELDYGILIPELQALLICIKKGVKTTSEIVKGLRIFSRLDESLMKITDLHENIDATLMMLHNKYKGRVEIVKNYGQLPLVKCFPGKLNQVFMNILSNAIQAIKSSGKIEITTKCLNPENSEQLVEIRFKDSGEGIPDSIKKRIFEPFFTTKEVGIGTGLGLSISQGIIDKHHGTIEVVSNKNTGTEFIIRIPVNH